MNKNEKFVITINRELGSGGKTEEQMTDLIMQYIS